LSLPPGDESTLEVGRDKGLAGFFGGGPNDVVAEQNPVIRFRGGDEPLHEFDVLVRHRSRSIA
jgi:hypothetical protein